MTPCRPVRLAITLLFTLTFSSLACAQDLSGFEKVLFPVSAWAVGGAGGSSFSTSNLVHASGDIEVYPVYQRADVPEVVWVPGVVSVHAGEDQYLFSPNGPPSVLGRILYVKEPGAAWFSSVLYASNAAGDSSVVSPPVVRESAFLTGGAVIPQILSRWRLSDTALCRSASAEARHVLRVYDPDARGDGLVRVRAFDEQILNGAPLFDVVVALDRREGTDPSFPNWGEVPLPEICHPFSCHTPCAGGTQRLELEPLTSGLRYWALVSGTDNVSQRVTLYWPQ